MIGHASLTSSRAGAGAQAIGEAGDSLAEDMTGPVRDAGYGARMWGGSVGVGSLRRKRNGPLSGGARGSYLVGFFGFRSLIRRHRGLTQYR